MMERWSELLLPGEPLCLNVFLTRLNVPSVFLRMFIPPATMWPGWFLSRGKPLKRDHFPTFWREAANYMGTTMHRLQLTIGPFYIWPHGPFLCLSLVCLYFSFIVHGLQYIRPCREKTSWTGCIFTFSFLERAFFCWKREPSQKCPSFSDRRGSRMPLSSERFFLWQS